MIVPQPTAVPFADPPSQVAITRLLIIGASPVTRHHPAPMPAIQRYDGADYRFLRRTIGAGLLGVNLLADTELLILSAEYGLLRSDQPICDDGRRMSRERAVELASRVSQYLVGWFQACPTCRAACVDVTYSALAALAGFEAWCRRHQVAYTELAGPPSERLHLLKAWLLVPTVTPVTPAPVRIAEPTPDIYERSLA